MVLQGAVAEPAKHLMQRRIWKALTPKVYAYKKLFINANLYKKTARASSSVAV
jgi:hypothetical protein